MNGVLEHLSARMGGLYGLPELHILIQDTVNGTLKNLKGIVETHVNRTLEAAQFKIVKDMVMRLLTEEILRVTELSAQALTRREMANVEINQKRLFESLAATESALHKRLEAFDAEQTRLAAGLERQSGEQDGLRSRMDELGNGLEKLDSSVQSVSEVAGRINRLQVLCNAQEGRAQDLQCQFSQLEQTCAERYAAAPALEDLTLKVGRLSQRQEERGEEWLSAALKPYAFKEELARGLSELKAQVEDQASKRHQAVSENMHGVASAASSTQRGLDSAVAAHGELRTFCESERAARGQLQEQLRSEVARLRDELAPQASVDSSLSAQREELSQLAGAIEEAQAKAEAGRAELRAAVGEVHAQLQRSEEAIRANEEGVKKVSKQISYLDECQVKIQAGFADEKTRAQVIMEQQYGNRQELQYLTERVDGLGQIGLAAGELRERTDGQQRNLAALSDQVTQWKDAIAAQQGLRRDAASLRSDLEGLRETVKKLQEEQAQGIQQLSKLHTKWLVPKS